VGEYQTIEVTPVTGVIGAQIEGVDLREPLTEQQRDDIHTALMRHYVVFFRDQDLTDDQQLAFADNFGEPARESLDPDEKRVRRTFTLEDTPDSPPKADRWHTDVAFVDTPPDIAFLNMRATPVAGGDTMWVSLYAAYEHLSPTMREAIEGLEVEMGLGATRDAILELYGPEYLAKVEASFVAPVHPLVRIHPVTGRPALFLAGPFSRQIVGMHPDESEVLLTFLKSRLDDPNIQIRWKWKQYDLAMWDERCTNHRALSDHYPAFRQIRRCMVGGGVPVGPKAATAAAPA
jgi:taurine dioxygenase